MTESLGVAPALVRLSFLVNSIYSEVCAGYDLTAPQAQLLCVIRDQPRGMTELTDLLRLEKSSVSGLVDRVERRGLLRRQMSPADRRAVTVAPTAAGKRVTRGFYDEITRRLHLLVADLPAAERDVFTLTASRIVLDEAVPPIFGAAAA